jgi:hypothetical protein
MNFIMKQLNVFIMKGPLVSVMQCRQAFCSAGGQESVHGPAVHQQEFIRLADSVSCDQAQYSLLSGSLQKLTVMRVKTPDWAVSLHGTVLTSGMMFSNVSLAFAAFVRASHDKADLPPDVLYSR